MFYSKITFTSKEFEVFKFYTKNITKMCTNTFLRKTNKNTN